MIEYERGHENLYETPSKTIEYERTLSISTKQDKTIIYTGYRIRLTISNFIYEMIN